MSNQAFAMESSAPSSGSEAVPGRGSMPPEESVRRLQLRRWTQESISIRLAYPFARLGSATLRLLLAGAGAPADEGARLERPFAMRVLEAMAEQDPLVGLRAAQYVAAGDLDTVEYAARRAPTMGDALSCLSRYFALIDDGLETTVLRDGKSVIFYLSRHGRNQPSAASDFLLGVVAGFCRRNAVHHQPPAAVHFAHPRPSHSQAHHQLFRAPVVYDCDHDAVVFASEWVTTPTHHPSDRLFEVFASDATFQLAAMSGKRAVSLHTLRLVRALSDAEHVDMRRAASAQGMSVATLRRRLGHEDTTYSFLEERHRRTEALRALRVPGLSIRDLAYRLGYADVSSFDRAFRRWTGLSPSTYRATELAWPGNELG